MDKRWTLVLDEASAHAIMDALANNTTLQEFPEKYSFPLEFIDDEGTARADAVYQDVGRQLLDQGWGEPVN